MRSLRFPTHDHLQSQAFLLQQVQPALSGLMDGSLSILAPIFAVATALGAGVSMAFSERLSDTGDVTGRGKPARRGAITGVGTFLGGGFHTLPFLITSYHLALVVACRRDRYVAR